MAVDLDQIFFRFPVSPGNYEGQTSHELIECEIKSLEAVAEAVKRNEPFLFLCNLRFTAKWYTGALLTQKR